MKNKHFSLVYFHQVNAEVKEILKSLIISLTSTFNSFALLTDRNKCYFFVVVGSVLWSSYVCADVHFCMYGDEYL